MAFSQFQTQGLYDSAAAGLSFQEFGATQEYGGLQFHDFSQVKLLLMMMMGAIQMCVCGRGSPMQRVLRRCAAGSEPGPLVGSPCTCNRCSRALGGGGAWRHSCSRTGARQPAAYLCYAVPPKAATRHLSSCDP